ncbi:MAG: membrane integrity-associated transporter subunit PqiC [Pseudomonas sp.]
MSFPLRLMLATALLMLVACRGDPIHFHTLTPTLPANTEQAGNVDVQIEVISVPPQVDRQQLVIRQSDSSLTVLDGHWWGASLVDELRSALVQQLPTNNGGRRVSVRLDVQRLDSIPGQYALLDVKWRLRDRSVADAAFAHCHSRLKTAASAEVDALVIAHQNNLQHLAKEIIQAAGGGGCPTRS